MRSRLSARAVAQNAVLLPRIDTGFDAPEPAASPQGIDHQLDQELFLRALWVEGGPDGLDQILYGEPPPRAARARRGDLPLERVGDFRLSGAVAPRAPP